MVVILMKSANMATVGLLKIKVFWNKIYGLISYVHDVTNQILSHESNYTVDVVMSSVTLAFIWEKLSDFIRIWLNLY